jgi:hypothetical protein
MDLVNAHGLKQELPSRVCTVGQGVQSHDTCSVRTSNRGTWHVGATGAHDQGEQQGCMAKGE